MQQIALWPSSLDGPPEEETTWEGRGNSRQVRNGRICVLLHKEKKRRGRERRRSLETICNKSSPLSGRRPGRCRSAAVFKPCLATRNLQQLKQHRRRRPKNALGKGGKGRPGFTERGGPDNRCFSTFSSARDRGMLRRATPPLPFPPYNAKRGERFKCRMGDIYFHLDFSIRSKRSQIGRSPVIGPLIWIC